MSHLVNYKLNMNNWGTLKKALKSMGYTPVEGGRVKGYDTKKDVDVTVKEVPQVGFTMTDGKIEMHSDFYGTGIDSKEFQKKIESEYTHSQISDAIKKRGLQMQTKRLANNKIKLVINY